MTKNPVTAPAGRPANARLTAHASYRLARFEVGTVISSSMGGVVAAPDRGNGGNRNVRQLRPFQCAAAHRFPGLVRGLAVQMS